MATQLEIARQVGLDVSSVNKILNRVAGPKFKKTTVALVFQAAREIGYDLSKPTKNDIKRRAEELETYLRLLVPEHVDALALAQKFGVPFELVHRMREFLYPKPVRRGRRRSVPQPVTA